MVAGAEVVVVEGRVVSVGGMELEVVGVVEVVVVGLTAARDTGSEPVSWPARTAPNTTTAINGTQTRRRPTPNHSAIRFTRESSGPSPLSCSGTLPYSWAGTTQSDMSRTPPPGL